MAQERELDIVVYGATGFTGRLVAAYFAGLEGGFRWAIAGRSEAKLEEVRGELELGEEVGTLVADSSDDASLRSLTARTRVLLTTVGPYVKYGEPLVAACVESGTDYADITGEPEFVGGIIRRYHERARERGLRLVSCCGFDSIPHDLGAYMMVRELPDDGEVELEGFVSAGGTLSGGTWQSAIHAFSRPHRQRMPREDVVGEGRRVRGLRTRPHYEKAVKGWVAPMPTIDPLIVLRSARAMPSYGRVFRYGHYLRAGSFPRLVGLGAGVGTLLALAQIPPTRDLLLKYRQSGDGPTAEERERGWFRVTFAATCGDRRLTGKVSGGDPGYGETSKMVAESALCLALDRDRLPDRHGVLTPAAAMAEPLLERLRSAGMVFEVDG